MFGVDWHDPATLWLNLTNLGLGLLTLGAVLALGWAVFADVITRMRVTAGKGLIHYEPSLDPHMLHTPELGLTMADGGEPEVPKTGKKSSKS